MLTPPEIEFIDIFLKNNYEFFHAHFLDFHGHIFFNFSRAQNLVSRTQIHENFHGHFFFSRALFLIFFTGGTPIFTGKKKHWSKVGVWAVRGVGGCWVQECVCVWLGGGVGAGYGWTVQALEEKWGGVKAVGRVGVGRGRGANGEAS